MDFIGFPSAFYKDVDEVFSSKLYNKKEFLDAVSPVVPGIW